MENRKHIALVTAWFPPKQGVATNRMIAFANYLSVKYRVTVFTQGDAHLDKALPEGIQVHYIPSKSILNRLASNKKDRKWLHQLKTALRVVLSRMVKNPDQGWQEAVVKEVIAVHQQNPVDVLISSYAPVEAHLAAIEIKKQFPDLIWIADMRDEMSKNPGYIPRVKTQLRLVEQTINRYADALVTVSAPILDDFKELCPSISHFEEVRNGFNHEIMFPLPTEKVACIRFGYFGSFYGDIKPTNIFRALELLVDEVPFEFHIYGSYANFDIPLRLKKQVFIHSGLIYEEAIRKMNEQDVNVVIYPTNGRKGVYTGKLFDYISARKPVLALMDETDVAAQLLSEMNAGYVCDNGNLEGLRKCILKIKDDLTQGEWRVASQEQIRTLHREEQIKKLDALIQRLL